jgi:phage I-like protein
MTVGITPAGAVEGRVDWTGAGRDLLAERADRYLSPSVVFDRASRTIRRLVSAGLTNKPDFRMPALAREDGADGPGDAPDAAGPLAAVATALGLDAGAGIEAVLDAIATARSPDPARFVPASAVREMIAERGRMVARMREDEARARVDAAISGGCLPPAMRDWAVARRDLRGLSAARHARLGGCAWMPGPRKLRCVSRCRQPGLRLSVRSQPGGTGAADG